jgi:hypothetical protein
MKIVPLTGSDVYFIEQANLVAGSSLIYDQNFEQCYNPASFDPATEYLAEEVAKRIRRIPASSPDQQAFEFVVQPQKIININGTVVPFNLIHPYNYFHFLIESLPTLFVLIASQTIHREHVIVSGILHPNMMQALNLITGDRFQLIELHLLNSVKSAKTVVMRDSFSCNELINGNMPENHEFNASNLLALRSFFGKYVQPPADPGEQKLFVVRQSGQRNIVNIKELIAVAGLHNFKVVYADSLSFFQQLQLFSTASVIVGPTGAWLANLLFVNAAAKVKVLYPVTCKTPVSIWQKLGGLFGIDVSDHYFNDIVLNACQPIHSDFVVDAGAFADILKS